MTERSAKCEQDANHPGLSLGRRGSGIEAGLRPLTTMSRDCDKADFPSRPSCEMRVGVSVCGKNALDKDVAFLVLPRKRTIVLSDLCCYRCLGVGGGIMLDPVLVLAAIASAGLSIG